MEKTIYLTWPVHLIDLSDPRWKVIECPECGGTRETLQLNSAGRLELAQCIECEGAGQLGLFTSSVETEGVGV